MEFLKIYNAVSILIFQNQNDVEVLEMVIFLRFIVVLKFKLSRFYVMVNRKTKTEFCPFLTIVPLLFCCLIFVIF